MFARWWPAPVSAMVAAISAVPLLLLISQFRQNELGPNPVETLTHATGDWALRFLLLSLTITPARRLLGVPQLIRARRLLGLAAFFYGMLHLAVWAYFDKSLSTSEMWSDVLSRQFITAGMLALALMVPLAITSTAGWIRRLGGRNWQRLHRLVYVSAVAAVVHYYWLVKSDVGPPLAYSGILAVLLAVRLIPVVQKRLAAG